MTRIAFLYEMSLRVELLRQDIPSAALRTVDHEPHLTTAP
jgi:hypothetical protein